MQHGVQHVLIVVERVPAAWWPQPDLDLRGAPSSTIHVQAQQPAMKAAGQCSFGGGHMSALSPTSPCQYVLVCVLAMPDCWHPLCWLIAGAASLLCYVKWPAVMRLANCSSSGGMTMKKADLQGNCTCCFEG